MSVIWSGVTEEGAVVPVQVTAEGKVIAVGDGPEGDYLKLTGGNLTGDLTLGTYKITLDATSGSGEFFGDVRIGGTLSSPPSIELNADGSAEFLGDLITTSANAAVKIIGTGTNSYPSLRFKNDAMEYHWQIDGSNDSFRLYDQSTSTTLFSIQTNGDLYLGGGTPSGDQIRNPRIRLNGDGSASFAGDVVIGSRGEQWLIRESNGVAMLVKQTLIKQPREENLRDLPNELDLIEAALNEIMDKLRMTPPAGWPVWDGQSEVTSDNDNA